MLHLDKHGLGGAAATDAHMSIPTMTTTPIRVHEGRDVQASPGTQLPDELPIATPTPSIHTSNSGVSHPEQLRLRSSRARLLSKRQRLDMDKRQAAGAGVGIENDGYPSCTNVGNERLSCYPEQDTTLQQGEFSKFIWNTNYPVYIGAGYVDIHLLSAGSEEELFAWRNVSTFRGSVGYQVDDAWLPTQTTWTEGQTLTHSYYFVIATRGADINTGVPHQATFEILQTAPPATLASQLAAAAFSSSSRLLAAGSPGASSASSPSPTPTITSFIDGIPPAVATLIVLGGPTDLGSIPLTLTGDLSTITNLAGLTILGASISSAQSSLSSVLASLSSAGSSIPPGLLSSLSDLASSNSGILSTESSVVSSIARTRGPSVLQGNDGGNGDPVPSWAIALIAVFGFLALLAALVALWFILRRMRRKRRESKYIETKGLDTSSAGGPSSTIPTREGSALEGGAAAAGATLLHHNDEKQRPLSESFSDGTGNTGRMSSTSAAFPAGTGTGTNTTNTGGTGSRSASGGTGVPARAGSAASGAIGAVGIGALAALASRRSDSPAMRPLERSYTDRTDSPHQFYESHHTPTSARFAGAAAGGAGNISGSGGSSGGRPGIINKASSMSLGTNASTNTGTIAPYDAAIMADAYRNILRKPEFPHRNDDSSNSGEGGNDSTPKDENGSEIIGGGARPHTPKASGTTTPMAFGDSGSEGDHHHSLGSALTGAAAGAGRGRGNSTSTEDSTASGARQGKYGNRESDEEDATNEAHELIKHELANEGTSVKSNVERKRPDIRQS